MSTIELPVRVSAVNRETTADEVGELMDKVMEHLIDIDIDITGTLTEGRLVFVAPLDDDVEPDFNGVWVAVRTALHAAGVSTPRWEEEHAG